MYDIEKIRETVPEECSISPEHAQAHLTSLLASLQDEDIEQAIHDADLCGRILLVWAHDVAKEKQP